MADDFKELLKAQQQTTEMLRLNMMTSEQREAERAAAEERRAAMAEAARKGWETRRLNTENESNDTQDATVQAIESLTDQQKSNATVQAIESLKVQQESNAEIQEDTGGETKKTGSMIGKFITFMRGNRAEAAETAADTKANADKNRSLLSKISGGINGLYKNAKDTAKKAGKTGLAVLKGIAFGALLYAFGEFLQSEQFAKITSYIKDTLLPKLSEFYNKFFGEEGSFLSGISALFSDESGIGAVVIALTGATALFGVSKLAKVFGPLKDGIGLLLSGFSGITDRIPKIKLPGFGKKDSVVPDAAGGPTKRAGGLGKVGSSIASVGKGAGEGIGGFIKGMAGGLAALANPATLIGLAAVVLAINGIAAAVRIASPAFEPFGKLVESAGESFKSVFEGLGSTIESIGTSIGTVIESVGNSIGAVIDKITAMETAGAEATTKQIKELSDVPADNMIGAAIGIEKMKAALDGFGGGTFTKVMGSIFGGGGPIEDILELAEKSETLNKAANAVMAIAGSGVTYKQLMDEEARQSRIAELEKTIGEGVGNRFNPLSNSQKDIDEAKTELAKLQAQTSSATAGRQVANLQANLQSTFIADPRVEAMITSAINKSKLATAPVVNNVVTNNTDARNQSQNTQQQVGAPLSNPKYPNTAQGSVG